MTEITPDNLTAYLKFKADLITVMMNHQRYSTLLNDVFCPQYVDINGTKAYITSHETSCYILKVLY